MSDSELSEVSTTPLPPDHEIEKSLRHEVVNAQKNDIEYTVNSIRTASEEKLGLTKGFYKNSAEWVQRSKDIIKDQSVQPSLFLHHLTTDSHILGHSPNLPNLSCKALGNRDPACEEACFGR